jgi:hypothetical protein
MLGRLQDLTVRISKTWWLYLIVLFLFVGSLQALMRIGDRFPAYAAGAVPFDLQNALQPAQVYPQLAGYTEQARQLYYAFTLIDYAFPFFAGLFITATVAFGLRYSLPRVYETLVARKLLPVLMLATAFDWLENVAAASAIVMYPSEIGWLPGLLVFAKKCKLGCIVFSNGHVPGRPRHGRHVGGKAHRSLGLRGGSCCFGLLRDAGLESEAGHRQHGSKDAKDQQGQLVTLSAATP